MLSVNLLSIIFYLLLCCMSLSWISLYWVSLCWVSLCSLLWRSFLRSSELVFSNHLTNNLRSCVFFIEKYSSEIFFLNLLDIWYSLNILTNNYIISDYLKRYLRHFYFTILIIFVRTHLRKFCEYGPKNIIHKTNYKIFMSDFRAWFHNKLAHFTV